MRKVICSVCGSEKPSGDVFVRDGQPVCSACVASSSSNASAQGNAASDESGALQRVADPTVCALCRTDYGDQELPLVGGKPICATCSVHLYSRPFPLWLKASLAVLLVLLGVALWHGRKYFSAGQHMVRGERAMTRLDYKTASDEFAQVIAILPDTQRAVLLGAKSRFMAGDPDGALRFFNGRKGFTHDSLFNEVNALLTKSVHAVRKARKAIQLDAAGQSDEAAHLMTEAASEYPQSENLGIMANLFNGRAAFYHKDYDAALKFSQAAWDKSPTDPNLTATLSSALACKYALTGDQPFRAQAEQMLAKAQELSNKSPQDHVAYLEYAPRILYRLQTREIIDNAEYQRRFGSTTTPPNLKPPTKPGSTTGARR
jgi:tetratricopeptide (TPR) repeat protein